MSSTNNPFAILGALDPDEPVGQESKSRLKDERHCGFTGLLNQGATCYLNSLLQSLYMTPEFRTGLFALTNDDLIVPTKTAKSTATDGTPVKSAAVTDAKSAAPTATAAPIASATATPTKDAKSAPATAVVASSAAANTATAAGTAAAAADPRVRVVPCELQRLFGRLQSTKLAAVSTAALTDTAFKWDSRDVYQQHDVSELNRILIDAIEKSLHHTRAANLMPSLYKGAYVQEVECLVCHNVTSREDAFYDLSLDVAGFNSLIESLDQFTAKEELKGGNQYFCGKCAKKVDARKGIRLVRLPPILTFCLNRFRFDWERNAREKITDSFAFPTRTIDLSAYLKPPATGAAATAAPVASASAAAATKPTATPSSAASGYPNALTSTSNEYELNAVIIHRGTGAGAGHYFAYIRDCMKEGKWDKSRAKKGANGGGGGGSGGGGQQQDTIPRGRPRGAKKVAGGYWNWASEHQNDPAVVDIRKVLLTADQYTLPISDLGSQFSTIIGGSWKQLYKDSCGGLPDFLKQNSNIFSIDIATGQYVTLLAVERPKAEPVATAAPATAADDTGKRRSARLSNKKGEASGEDADLAAAIKQSELQAAADKEKADAEAAVKLVAASEAAAKEKEAEEEWQWFDFNDDDVTPIHASAIESQFGGKKASETAYMLVYRRRVLDANGRTVRPPVPALPKHIVQAFDDAKRLKEETARIEDEIKHRITILFSVFDFADAKTAPPALDVKSAAAGGKDGKDSKSYAGSVGASAAPVPHMTHYRLTTHDNSTIQTVLQEMREQLPVQTSADKQRLEVLMVKGKNQVTAWSCIADPERNTLETIGVKTGNELFVEILSSPNDTPKLTTPIAVAEFKRRNELMRVCVANCSSGCAPDAAPRVYPFFVSAETCTVVELKVQVLSLLSPADRARAEAFGGGRLKSTSAGGTRGAIMSDEHKLLTDYGVKNGHTVSFECEILPTADEICIRCSLCVDGKPIDKAEYKEFILPLKQSLSLCKRTIARAFNCEPDTVRLRRVGKHNKPGAVFFEESELLINSEIEPNETLLLETKALRLPGHMTFQLYAQLPPPGGCAGPITVASVTAASVYPPVTAATTTAAASDAKSSNVDTKHSASASPAPKPATAAADAKSAPATPAATTTGTGVATASKEPEAPPPHPFPGYDVDFNGLVPLPEVTIDGRITLNAFKVQLASTPVLSAYVSDPKRIRLGVFRSGDKPGRILREYDRPMSAQSLSDDCALYIELLDREDNLPSGSTLFYVTRRVTRKLNPTDPDPKPVASSTAASGTTAATAPPVPVVRSYTPLVAMSLRKSELKQLTDLRWKLTTAVTDVAVESMSVMFYKPTEFVWKEMRQSQPKSKKNRKPHRPKKSKGKNRAAATGLHDFDSLGDRSIIAVKDRFDDPNGTDDGRTPYDIYFGRLAELARGGDGTGSGGGGSGKKYGDASQLKIEVEEFSDDSDSD